MRPRIRRATTEDIPFLGWVMFTAARSHLDKCVWETIFDETEAGLRDLLERVFQEGRSRGFSRAQILCLIGNDAAQRAWERNGFQLKTKKRNAAFEALFGCPGGKLFAQDL